MSESVYRTWNALNNLYLNCIEFQEDEFVKSMRLDNPLSHAKEFGTIKVCGPRRSGHSSAIIKHIQNCKDDHFLLISPRLQMSIVLEKMLLKELKCYREVSGIVHENDRFIYFASSILSEDIDYRLDQIIIDCSCLFSKVQMDNIYKKGIKLMKSSKYIRFIFMQ